MYLAYLLLRRYGGPGSDKLAAGMAIFSMFNVIFVYVSVNYWRTFIRRRRWCRRCRWRWVFRCGTA